MIEPRNEPMPPMMTMTKASITTVVPMPRNAVTSGVASTPPSAASAQPKPNTPVRTRSTSVPSACTISEFCETARIKRPARVRSRNCQMVIAAAVEVAQQGPLEHHADEPDHDRRDHERDQEAAGEHVRRVADIGAEHEDDAVGEVD